MIWVVDTCVLIDILKADPIFSKRSSRALQAKMDDVLAIAPITYVELAPTFKGDVSAQNGFLDALWIRYDFDGNRDAVLAAHRGSATPALACARLLARPAVLRAPPA